MRYQLVNPVGAFLSAVAGLAIVAAALTAIVTLPLLGHPDFIPHFTLPVVAATWLSVAGLGAIPALVCSTLAIVLWRRQKLSGLIVLGLSALCSVAGAEVEVAIFNPPVPGFWLVPTAIFSLLGSAVVWVIARRTGFITPVAE